MELKPLDYCPCESGKKVKFCCSKDIVAPIQQLVRQIEGSQRAAARQTLNSLLEQHGERPVLLHIKAQLALGERNFDEVMEAAGKLRDTAPDNPSGPAYFAVAAAVKEDWSAAVDAVQDALDRLEALLPSMLPAAVLGVSRSLIHAGHVAAGRAHLQLAAGLAPRESQMSQQIINELVSSDPPMLLADDALWGYPEPDEASREQFNAAAGLGRQGRWRAAVDKLAADEGSSLPLLKTKAVWNSFLGRESAAADWRAAAAHSDASESDAVIFEAVAQLVERPFIEAANTPLVRVEFPINDIDALSERLLADRQTVSSPVDQRQWAAEDQTPPRLEFELLDRPMPAAEDQLTLQNTPRTAGRVLLFGRQTDRDARLEWMTFKDGAFEDQKGRLTAIAGDSIGEVKEEEQVGEAPEALLIWRPSLRPPRGADAATVMKLADEARQQAALEVWPQTPHPALGGRTPQEALSDDAGKRQVAAALLVLESELEMDLDAVWEKLDLPTLQAPSGESADFASTPLVQLKGADMGALEDEQLLLLFRRSEHAHAHNLLQLTGRELLRRDKQGAQLIDPQRVRMALLETAHEPQEMVALIVESREAAVASGRSAAPWLLREIHPRLQLGDVERVQAIINELQRKHLYEEGVAESLAQILMELGVLGPDGQLRQPQPGAAAGGPGAPPVPGAAPTSDAPAAGGLWTPDQPAGGGESKESKLWLPGQD